MNRMNDKLQIPGGSSSASAPSSLKKMKVPIHSPSRDSSSSDSHLLRPVLLDRHVTSLTSLASFHHRLSHSSSSSPSSSTTTSVIGRRLESDHNFVDQLLLSDFIDYPELIPIRTILIQQPSQQQQTGMSGDVNAPTGGGNASGSTVQRPSSSPSRRTPSDSRFAVTINDAMQSPQSSTTFVSPPPTLTLPTELHVTTVNTPNKGNDTDASDRPQSATSQSSRATTGVASTSPAVRPPLHTPFVRSESSHSSSTPPSASRATVGGGPPQSTRTPTSAATRPSHTPRLEGNKHPTINHQQMQQTMPFAHLTSLVRHPTQQTNTTYGRKR